jgi:peptidoglycan/LPS O-acetylase OafA/YrhL
MLHLDMLRFIASIAIVFHHSREYFYPKSERAALSNGLALFVDLFFVISGYVIAHVYAERMTSWKDYGTFLQRRIGRLVPLHWVTLVLVIAIWVVLLRAGAHADHVPWFKPQCIGATVALLHAAYSCHNQIFNGQSWSISAEMGMYVAFPVFLLLGRWHRLFPIGVGLAVALTVLATIPVSGLNASNVEWESVQAYLRATPSFLFGMGLWWSRDLVRRLPMAQPILGASILMLIVAMLVPAPAWALLALVYTTVLAASAADLQARSGLLVHTIAPLGQLTYSIYMWHGLVIFVVMNILGDKLLHAGTALTAVLACITYALIVGTSYLSFFWIETPARKWIDRSPPFGKSAIGRGSRPASELLRN